jgi:PilZ domain-containing protein
MISEHAYELALAGTIVTSAGWMLRRGRRRSVTASQEAQRPQAPHTLHAVRQAPPAFWIVMLAETCDLLASWRPGRGVLIVPSPVAPRLGAKGVVRLELIRRPERASIHGTAVAVNRGDERGDDHFRVEFAPDAAGVRALRLLTAAAGAGQVPFRERAPRFRVEAPAVALAGGREVYTTTISISQGGCALRWSGSPPRQGEILHLRLGAGLREVAHAFAVRWVEQGSRHTSVGLELSASDQTAGRWQAYAGVASAGLRAT